MGNPSNSLEVAPNRFRTATLTNVAQSVTEGKRPILGYQIVGGAAAEVVIFRGFGAGATYFQVPIGIGAFIAVPIKWLAFNGLEILTATAAGDVEVVIFYT